MKGVEERDSGRGSVAGVLECQNRCFEQPARRKSQDEGTDHACCAFSEIVVKGTSTNYVKFKVTDWTCRA